MKLFLGWWLNFFDGSEQHSIVIVNTVISILKNPKCIIIIKANWVPSARVEQFHVQPQNYIFIYIGTQCTLPFAPLVHNSPCTCARELQYWLGPYLHIAVRRGGWKNPARHDKNTPFSGSSSSHKQCVISTTGTVESTTEHSPNRGCSCSRHTFIT